MKKYIGWLMAWICYVLGIVAAAYYGLWVMLIHPFLTLVQAFAAGNLTVALFVACGIKILFSFTLTGLIWCLGYIAYNHFKGKEDPDWEAMEQKQGNDYREERKIS